MGKLDRIIQTLFAIVAILLLVFKQITGIAAIILGIFVIIFLLTYAIGECPLNYPSKIESKSDKN